MKAILLLIGSLLMLGGCVSKQPVSKPIKESKSIVVIDAQPEPLKEVVKEVRIEHYKNLIFNTKLNVSSSQPNWVLFSNGTYIIFPTGTSNEDMRKSALGFLQRYNGETLKIKKSPLAKGWIVRSTTGIYNYISLEVAGDRMISDKNLAIIGKDNITKDKENLLIVHVNSKN